jgi:hypothetical protein
MPLLDLQVLIKAMRIILKIDPNRYVEMLLGRELEEF